MYLRLLSHDFQKSIASKIVNCSAETKLLLSFLVFRYCGARQSITVGDKKKTSKEYPQLDPQIDIFYVLAVRSVIDANRRNKKSRLLVQCSFFLTCPFFGSILLAAHRILLSHNSVLPNNELYGFVLLSSCPVFPQPSSSGDCLTKSYIRSVG